jgi:hypothetical protein
VITVYLGIGCIFPGISVKFNSLPEISAKINSLPGVCDYFND